jgi:hypothetical protein
MKKIPSIFFPFAVGIMVLFFIFLVRGPLMDYPDTKVYVGQVQYFNGTIAPDRDIQLRSFKPFYGIVGAGLSHFVSPEVAILLINLFFFFGLIISFFYLLKEIGFSELYAGIGASWAATGYPLLKYGLALLTDISGWFFAAATITIFLIGMRKNSGGLLVLSSMIGFLGSLCKETGILGLGFAGLYLLLYFWKSKDYLYLKKIAIISAPFLMFQAVFLYILFTRTQAHTSFIQWFFFNKEGVGYELHTLYHFTLTELSTFSLLWVYVLAGIYAVWRHRRVITQNQWIIAVCLFVTVLPPLIWPVFLTRILYIDYLAVIPLALIGLIFWRSKNQHNTKSFYLLSVLPIVSAGALFLLAGGNSLLPLFESFFNS